MDKTNNEKPTKKGIFSILKESMKKASEGCGPGCGCHAEDQKENVKEKCCEPAKGSKKE